MTGRKRRTACVLLLLLISAVLSGCTETVQPVPSPSVSVTPVAPASPEPTPTKPVDLELTPSETVSPTPDVSPEPEPTPTQQVYRISFAGDCTLGSEHGSYGTSGSFISVVGEQYAYPFAGAYPYFAGDDFTFVNLEGTLTDCTVPAEKTYRFRGPQEYAKILTAGSVECVTLANNHSHDYGQEGYADTKAALEAEQVAYVENGGSLLYTTESGLVIGVYAGQFSIDVKGMKKEVVALRQQGAEIVIAAFHWGVEGSYSVTHDQEAFAHAAIDAGVDVVFGHHPHVLQRIETYKNGVIYYSLGNFAFGGNRSPRDKDTAVIQQLVIREPDGSVHLGDTVRIPFRLSSTPERNDYQPTPYSTDDPAYERAMSKLDGTFDGPDLNVTPSPSESPEASPEPETEPSAEPDPALSPDVEPKPPAENDAQGGEENGPDAEPPASAEPEPAGTPAGPPEEPAQESGDAD